jgi:hypothetical protein
MGCCGRAMADCGLIPLNVVGLPLVPSLIARDARRHGRLRT